MLSYFKRVYDYWTRKPVNQFRAGCYGISPTYKLIPHPNKNVKAHATVFYISIDYQSGETQQFLIKRHKMVGGVRNLSYVFHTLLF